MSNYLKDQKLREQRASKLVDKIQKQEKKPFEKGETPAETLVNIHNSDVIQDHENRIDNIEEAKIQKQLDALASQLHSAQATIQELKKQISQSSQEKVQTVSKQSTPRTTATNTTSVWIRDANGEVIRNPRYGNPYSAARYDKSFYQYHYGVPYNPAGYSGPVH